MPFAGTSHVVSAMGMYKCFSRSDLVRDRARGFGCPGIVGPNMCLLLGCLLQGVRHPVLGSTPEHALRLLRTPAMVTSQSSLSGEACPGEDTSMKAVLPGLGQALLWLGGGCTPEPVRTSSQHM